jgi:hypothetical protein
VLLAHGAHAYLLWALQTHPVIPSASMHKVLAHAGLQRAPFSTAGGQVGSDVDAALVGE